MAVRTRTCGAVLAVLVLLLAHLACDGSVTLAPISILSPVAGDVFAIGADMTIEWQLREEITTVSVEVSRDGGLTWVEVAAGVDATALGYSWTVEGPPSGACRVRVSDANDPTRPAAMTYSFEIAAPFLTVVSPNGDEKWAIGSTRTIRWSQVGIQNVRIELSRNSGVTWPTLIVASTDAATGSYSWTVEGAADAECRIRIADADGTLSDTSNDDFEIAMPTLSLGALATDWQLQDQMVISWTAIGVDDVGLEISREASAWAPLAPDAVSMPAQQGSYTWTVEPGSVGVPQDCRIRIVNAADAAFPDPDVSAVFTVDWDGVYRVSLGGDNSDGSTWATAYTHPQTAMDSVGSGSEIWVAAGNYVENGTDDAVLAFDPGVAVYGGFAGTEYDLALRNPDVYTTRLDGQNSVSHVVMGASGIVLDGFVVTRGATGGSGAGMSVISEVGVVVANCKFESNAAGTGSGSYGGGMLCDTSTVTVTSCEFLNNSANQGGGAACGSGNVTFEKCLFRGNDASASSGDVGGGGLYAVSEGTISNCVFWNNSAYRGGGMYTDVWGVGTLLVVNCTVAGNSATYGGGIYDFYSESYLPIVNTIVWGNTSTGVAVAFPSYYPPHIDYSCLQNLISLVGGNNIYDNPSFRSQATGNFRLIAGSPCIDAGTTVDAPADDFEGDPRGAAVDMGAYEY